MIRNSSKVGLTSAELVDICLAMARASLLTLRALQILSTKLCGPKSSGANSLSPNRNKRECCKKYIYI